MSQDIFKLLVLSDIQIRLKKKQQIFTFENLEPVNYWYFCHKKND